MHFKRQNVIQFHQASSTSVIFLFVTFIIYSLNKSSVLQKDEKKEKERNQSPLGFAIQISVDFAIQNFVPKIVLLITGIKITS